MKRRDGAVLSAVVSGLVTSAIVVILVSPLIVWGGKSIASTAAIFLIDVCLVASMQAFIGNSGILSFGQVTFMGVGAYVTAWLSIPAKTKADQLPEVPEWLLNVQFGLIPSALIGALVAAVIAALVGLVLVRMTVNAMVMATFALLLVVYSVWLNWAAFTRGSNGVFGIPRLVTPWVAVVAAVIFIVVIRMFKSSRLGLQLRATREDDLAASASGINVRLTRYGAWVIGGALMGAAGSLWAFNIMAFDPGQFSFAMTFALLAMLIIGGRESVLGAVVGALIIVLVTELFSRVEQGVSIGSFELPRITGTVQFVIAVLIIIALVLRPEGVVGRREIEDLIPALGRALRRRRRLDLEAKPATEVETRQGDVVLSGSDLRKAFRGVRAVDGIDIEVRAGEILGLIGPNGSGKSTLLNLLSGITAADSGTITLNGVDVTGWPSHRVSRAGLARTFQNIRLFQHLTVDDNVLAPASATVVRADGAMEQLGLIDLRFLEANTLSYGLQRRLEIARAMSTGPSVVLLDEPAAGMNHSESDVLLADIRALASQYGCGVIIIDHDLRLIMRLCDRIQVLEAGHTIAVGPPAQIAEDPTVTAAYLGDASADPVPEPAAGQVREEAP